MIGGLASAKVRSSASRFAGSSLASSTSTCMPGWTPAVVSSVGVSFEARQAFQLGKPVNVYDWRASGDGKRTNLELQEDTALRQTLLGGLA